MERKIVRRFGRHMTNLSRVISSLIDIDKEIESESGTERPKEYYDLKLRLYRSQFLHWIGEVLNDAGVRQFEEGNLEEAVKLFNKCLRYVPDLYEAYNNLGVILAKQGDYSSALEMTRRALEINIKNTVANANLQRITEHQVGSIQLGGREMGASLQVVLGH